MLNGTPQSPPSPAWDVGELPTERGVTVDHITVYRWVQRFTPGVRRGGEAFDELALTI